ncbi:MAG: hypothetical protein AAF539_06730, partial [Planctomycetota bacterium]
MALIPCLTVALIAAADTSSAKAGGFSLSIGNPGLVPFGGPFGGVNRVGVGYPGFGVSTFSTGFRGVSPYRAYYPRASRFNYVAP